MDLDFKELQTDDVARRRLINRFCPVFWLHKNEKYFPCHAEDYIRGCSLYYKNQVLLEKITDPLQIVGLGNGLDASHNAILSGHENNSDYHLVRIANKSGNRFSITGEEEDFDTDYTTIPSLLVYMNFLKDNNHHYVDIIYLMIYAFNGTKVSHDFDLEASVIRYNIAEDQIEGVFMSVHGDWNFTDRSQLEMTADGRPILYVANESHCVEPNEGTFHRLFNFGTDYTNRGHRWDPLTVESDLVSDVSSCTLLPDKEADLPSRLRWIRFVGRRGANTGQNFNIYRDQNNLISGLYYRPPLDDSQMISGALGKDKLNSIIKILQYTSIGLITTWCLLNLTFFVTAKNPDRPERLKSIYVTSQIVIIVTLVIQMVLMTFNSSALDSLHLSGTN